MVKNTLTIRRRLLHARVKHSYKNDDYMQWKITDRCYLNKMELGLKDFIDEVFSKFKLIPHHFTAYRQSLFLSSVKSILKRSGFDAIRFCRKLLIHRSGRVSKFPLT